MKLIPLPAFNDNYLWMIIQDDRAVVVDPGDPAPVLGALEQYKLKLEGILVTHHHSDHIGGIQSLVQKTNAQVFAPLHPSIPSPYRVANGGDQISILDIPLRVMAVPGHTLTHLAYFAPQTKLGPILFCGDTLFSGGCGRMFEGTENEFWTSLESFCALPDETLVCPAHEYTLSNLKFARAIEPGNKELLSYTERCTSLRARSLPTLPSTIGQEKSINPFLRVNTSEVIRSAQSKNPKAQTPAQIFGVLRSWKNDFS
jgi:hydroxyacylglutathione hydrolase